jgi:hypothetical protein
MHSGSDVRHRMGSKGCITSCTPQVAAVSMCQCSFLAAVFVCIQTHVYEIKPNKAHVLSCVSFTGTPHRRS